MEQQYDDVEDENEPLRIITWADIINELYELNDEMIREMMYREARLENLLYSACAQTGIEFEYEEKDAIDFISTNKFQNGSEAFILDDVFNQPLEYDTVYNLLAVYKQKKNPFTREEIKRIIKIQVKYV